MPPARSPRLVKHVPNTQLPIQRLFGRERSFGLPISISKLSCISNWKHFRNCGIDIPFRRDWALMYSRKLSWRERGLFGVAKTGIG